jgi:hypothetical protein
MSEVQMKKLICLFFLFWVYSATAKEKIIFTAYVEYEKTPDFAEPELIDSMIDMKAAFQDAGFQVVEDRQKADIVVIILRRNNDSQGFMDNSFRTSKYLFVRLEVGEYKKEWMGSAKRWSIAAWNLAEDFAKFVKNNREQILKRRTDKPIL